MSWWADSFARKFAFFAQVEQIISLTSIKLPHSWRPWDSPKDADAYLLAKWNESETAEMYNNCTVTLRSWLGRAQRTLEALSLVFSFSHHHLLFLRQKNVKEAIDKSLYNQNRNSELLQENIALVKTFYNSSTILNTHTFSLTTRKKKWYFHFQFSS